MTFITIPFFEMLFLRFCHSDKFFDEFFVHFFRISVFQYDCCVHTIIRFNNFHSDLLFLKYKEKLFPTSPYRF